jgi:hypothetical protein
MLDFSGYGLWSLVIINSVIFICSPTPSSSHAPAATGARSGLSARS